MNASAALRRLPRALMGLCGPPRTPARRPRADTGSARPVRRSSSLGHSACAPSLRRSGGRPSMDFHSPPKLDHRDPVTSRRLPGCQTALPLLGFLRPTTRSQAGGSVCRRRIPPPPRAACGVWLPPSRPTPPALPARLARRSVPGLHPSRVSPHRDRYPSRGPCPPVVAGCARASPEENANDPAAFRAFFPRRVRADTGTTSGSGRRSLPGVRPSRACSRSTWRSLSSRRLPSRPQAA
jgi:hypothetical protein